MIGAGLSSSYLIDFLKKYSVKENWKVIVGDASIEQAKLKCKNHKNCLAIAFDINNKLQREKEISNADLVISLLPPTLHIKAARDCVHFKKHLVTASYISQAMQLLHKKAEASGVLLLNEMGLDPGIDHLSAMQMMDALRVKGAEITSFRSYCGGLVAKKFDSNPWHYKFTWNPKNVVTAGQSAAIYKHNGKLSYIPASRIFKETESIEKEYEAYLNRDSTSYIVPYGLQQANTVLRGTLRIKGFCEAWSMLASLGITDDGYIVQTNNLTWKQFTHSFLPKGCNNLKEYIAAFTPQKSAASRLWKQLSFLDLESDKPINMASDTPANLLLCILKDKWKLLDGEHDRIVMIHYINYTLNKKNFLQKAILEVEGESSKHTAMAKTVGLPMAIAAKLILNGKIKARGVCMPITPEFYLPILKELKEYGIEFKE